MQKGYVNISEILINNGMKSKEMADKDKISIGLKKRESTSKVKLSNELIQDNNYQNNHSK